MQINARKKITKEKKMHLKEYLLRKKISMKKFGTIIGLSQFSILRICNGGDTTASIAQKIEQETKGIVTLKDLCKPYPKQKMLKKLAWREQRAHFEVANEVENNH